MSTETPNHPDAVCSLHGLPCHELGEVLIERDALRSRLGMLMPADANFGWEEWPGGWPEILSAYETQRDAAAALRVEAKELRAHFGALAEQLERFRNTERPECDAAWFISRVSWHIQQALSAAPQGEVQP